MLYVHSRQMNENMLSVEPKNTPLLKPASKYTHGKELYMHGPVSESVSLVHPDACRPAYYIHIARQETRTKYYFQNIINFLYSIVTINVYLPN